MDRDFIVRGEHAVAYGLVDHVIERRELAGPLAAATAPGEMAAA
jgi:ATP-dependent protease ClpP protease subunit